MSRNATGLAASAGVLAALLLAAAPGCAAAASGSSTVTSSAVSSSHLSSSDKTILGQPLRYPDGAPARVDAKMVTIPPGAETGWHEHETMTIGYVLSGRITVEYRDEEAQVYEAGQVLLEALDWSHNGRNEGAEPVRILAISLGSPEVTSRTRGEKPLH